MSQQSTAFVFLEAQIRWYDGASDRSWWWFHGLGLAQIVCAASIPALAACSAEWAWARTATMIIAVLIAVITGWQVLFQFHAKWTRWRSTWLDLLLERESYLTGVDKYKDASSRDEALLKAITGIISREHTGWKGTQKEIKDAASSATRS